MKSDSQVYEESIAKCEAEESLEQRRTVGLLAVIRHRGRHDVVYEEVHRSLPKLDSESDLSYDDILDYLFEKLQQALMDLTTLMSEEGSMLSWTSIDLLLDEYELNDEIQIIEGYISRQGNLPKESSKLGAFFDIMKMLSDTRYIKYTDTFVPLTADLYQAVDLAIGKCRLAKSRVLIAQQHIKKLEKRILELPTERVKSIQPLTSDMLSQDHSSFFIGNMSDDPSWISNRSMWINASYVVDRVLRCRLSEKNRDRIVPSSRAYRLIEGTGKEASVLIKHATTEVKFMGRFTYKTHGPGGNQDFAIFIDPNNKEEEPGFIATEGFLLAIQLFGHFTSTKAAFRDADNPDTRQGQSPLKRSMHYIVLYQKDTPVCILASVRENNSTIPLDMGLLHKGETT